MIIFNINITLFICFFDSKSLYNFIDLSFKFMDEMTENLSRKLRQASSEFNFKQLFFKAETHPNNGIWCAIV